MTSIPEVTVVFSKRVMLQVDDCRVSDVDSAAAAFIDSSKFHGVASSQSQLWILFREDFSGTYQ